MHKINISEACKLSKISRPTFYKYIKNGNISVIKDGKNTCVEINELIRVFPNIKLNECINNIDDLHNLTLEIKHKDEVINMLKQQINDKQKENEFLKEQLTQITTNFTLVNKILENKTINHNKKFLGLF